MKGPITIIGLISGSSLDGLDIAVCTFDLQQPGDPDWSCVYAETVDFAEALTERLRNATQLNAKELFQLEHDFSIFSAEVINKVIQDIERPIDYICSHGHTVYHYPDKGWTVQIGKGATMAELTGIPCITDVRANDIALGGQGAPVAPIVEQWLLPGFDYYFNLGGISNISYHNADSIISFDSAPCNQVLNTYVQEIDKPYDDRGMLAQQGLVHEELLETWLAVEYLKLPAPKSLDNSWVKEYFTPLSASYNLSLQDRLATMVEFIAVQSSRDIVALRGDHRGRQRAFMTGGGAHNDFLMERISRHLVKQDVFTVRPDLQMINFKEAILLSLMGYLRVTQRTNTLSTVTGASSPTIGGTLSIPAPKTES